MNVFSHFRKVIIAALESLVTQGFLPGDLDFAKVTAEPPKEAVHGDIATNAAMVLAKQARMNPREIAALLCQQLQQNEQITTAEVAGPGFVNLRIRDEFWQQCLQNILKQGCSYGDSDMGQATPVNLEYVSVNPTGPMHIGHCRGAVAADILGSILQKAGYQVTREYYINDAGNQANLLAHSVYQRYLEALGQHAQDFGEYPGDYLIPVGQALSEKYADQWVGVPESEWLEPIRTFAVAAMMDVIRHDLSLLGIHHEIFTSEKAIISQGETEEAFKVLEDQGLIYQGTLPPPKGKKPEEWVSEELTLFRSTDFGDDSDRALRKPDGSWSYFSGDIAYHWDKVRRGYKLLIDVWGSDHVGYVKRLNAAVQALSQGNVEFEVQLCQLVKFMDKGKPVKMSKRAGTFIAVNDVVGRVGKDSVRFMMVTRKNDVPLDFDFAKVLEQSKDNPVFYVQYAHARACSIKRHIKELFPTLEVSADNLAKANLALLDNQEDIELVKLLAQWPRQIELAAKTREPHRIAYYLYNVASAFHALWTKGKDQTELRFLYASDQEKTLARFALVQAMAFVIASGLEVMGVKPVEEMR
ncbi:MAG: arginine--tRNA ligase [Pseudomonadota bacterium]